MPITQSAKKAVRGSLRKKGFNDQINDLNQKVNQQKTNSNSLCP